VQVHRPLVPPAGAYDPRAGGATRWQFIAFQVPYSERTQVARRPCSTAGQRRQLRSSRIRRTDGSCRVTRVRAAGQRPQRLALMSGLRHSSNIPIEGHFSALGMPNRSCVVPVRAVLRGDDTRTRPQSPSRCALGIGVLFRPSGPALSTGPVSSVEVTAGPSAGRVLGNAPGPTTADHFLRISIGHAATKRRRGPVVGRLHDMFDKDASGVSAPQHYAMMLDERTCGPRNAPMRPALDSSVALCQRASRGPGPCSAI
jgi:hypothetical protein